MQQLFLTISTVLVIFTYLFYVWAIIKGKAKPHRTTRFVILVITTVASASLLASGNIITLWLIGTSMLFSFFIFLLSIKYGMGGVARLDIFSLSVAALGIVIWQITDNPLLALYASIAADFFGFMPTIIKTYHHPETEPWIFFGISGTSAILNIFAQEVKSFENIVFPLYLVVINSLLVVLIIFPRRKKV